MDLPSFRIHWHVQCVLHTFRYTYIYIYLYIYIEIYIYIYISIYKKNTPPKKKQKNRSLGYISSCSFPSQFPMMQAAVEDVPTAAETAEVEARKEGDVGFTGPVAQWYPFSLFWGRVSL